MASRIESRAAAAMAAAIAGLIAVAPAAAQVGAIGGAPGSAASGASTTARAPIFTESAFVIPNGSWAGAVYTGYTSGSIGDATAGADFTFTQLLLGAFFAPADRLTLGVSVFPYASVSVSGIGGSADETGRGDAALYAKYQLWSAGNTAIAASASIGLPIGDDVFGAAGTSFNVAGIVSHTADRLSLHGALGVSVPSDELDGETTIEFDGALMYAAKDNITLGVELLGSTFSVSGLNQRYTSIDLAPGARFRLNPSLFLDTGLLVNASTSIGESPLDYGLVIGLTMSR